MHIAYPLQIGSNGRTAEATSGKYIRQLIEQVLFTMPGERVNHPDFGSGLKQLVFTPSDDELFTTTQFLVQGALQQWLGDLIRVEAVNVESEEATLKVSVVYVISSSQERRVEQFSYSDD